MKKVFITALVFTSLILGKTYSQVGIGTNSPAADAILDLSATNKALLLTRIANVGAIANPVNGMIVYDELSKCVRAYENGAWSPCFNGKPTVITVETISGENLVFMTHNLGADYSADPLTPSWKLNGAYIQWGKRGPTRNWQTEPTNGALGFAAAPTGETTADANAATVAGWSTATVIEGAWNLNEGTPLKTINDPCPNGFRVPTRNEWDSIFDNPSTMFSFVGDNWTPSSTNYSSGLLINSNFYLPATGVILANGSLLHRGEFGHYWSSTYDTNFGFPMSLVFDSFGVYPNTSNDMFFGFPVRCVAE